MTEDFKALCSLSGQDLVLWAFSRYKNLIYKKAIYYSRVSKGRIGKEDFASDVYMNLTYYLSFLKKQKAKEDKFMFYIYVTYAISKTLKQNRSPLECVSIEQNDLQDFIETRDDTCACEININRFYEKLTPRQVAVLKLKQKNQSITYKELGKRFNVCLQTIVRDTQLAKQTYNEMYGTHFAIGR